VPVNPSARLSTWVQACASLFQTAPPSSRRFLTVERLAPPHPLAGRCCSFLCLSSPGNVGRIFWFWIFTRNCADVSVPGGVSAIIRLRPHPLLFTRAFFPLVFLRACRTTLETGLSILLGHLRVSRDRAWFTFFECVSHSCLSGARSPPRSAFAGLSWTRFGTCLMWIAFAFTAPCLVPLLSCGGVAGRIRIFFPLIGVSLASFASCNPSHFLRTTRSRFCEAECRFCPEARLLLEDRPN